MNDVSASVGAKTDQGTRSHNEDAYWVSDEQTPVELGALYVVADGVGGQVHGAAAAQQAVQVVNESFYRLRSDGLGVPEALHDAILEANRAVYEQAQARGSVKMGCTLAAAVQHEGKLHVAHVGDARAYLLMEGRLRRLTRDDTWVQKQVDAGIITAAEAEKHELRNIVTQVLGNRLDITVHSAAAQELHAGDIFLLCSDGLHGVLGNEQLYRLLKSNPPPEAADALVQAAIEAETTDNVTAVVVNSGQNVARKGLAARASRRMPLWVMVTLGTMILLLIAWGVYGLLSANSISVEFGGGRETGENGGTLPLATDIAIPAQLPTAQPPTPLPPTITMPPPPTAAPPTATLPPTDTPPPLPTSTPTPPQTGCVVRELLYVWREDQVRSNTCDHYAREGFDLRLGQQVLILDNNAIPGNGPDAGCRPGSFIKVQSMSNPAITGWVLAGGVQNIPAGESCQP